MGETVENLPTTMAMEGPIPPKIAKVRIERNKSTVLEKFNTPPQTRQGTCIRDAPTLETYLFVGSMREVSGKLASKVDGKVRLVCFVERFGPKRQGKGNASGQKTSNLRNVGVSSHVFRRGIAGRLLRFCLSNIREAYSCILNHIPRLLRVL